MKTIGIVWAQFGPYHFARAGALKKLAGQANVHALELASRTSWYQWNRSAGPVELTTICPGAETEKLKFGEVFARTRKTLAGLNLAVCILPGYAPKQSLAALLASKSLGIRTVMMNESHAGTSRARGLAALLKRLLVGAFDAALVGGQPQKNYLVSLGLPADKIFTGYDAVDNEYFLRQADEVRARKVEVQGRYQLPEHYFLNLGRFVAKKNLEILIRGYRMFLNASPEKQTHLVLVGSGEKEAALKSLCQGLGLPVYDKLGVGSGGRRAEDGRQEPEGARPGVHFYGFRQIEENPVFYALADAFVLPSRWEEWGLVVNEAMASGLPVVVSETAGCAQDLLESGSTQNALRAETALRINRLGLASRLRQNGFVFDPASSGELSRILLTLAASSDLRDSMGRASQRIVEKFSCENFARNALLAAEAAAGPSPRKPGVPQEVRV